LRLITVDLPMVDVSYHHLMGDHAVRVPRAGFVLARAAVPTQASSAIACDQLKMHHFVSTVRAVTLSVPDVSPLVNADTPEKAKR
jgi:hypothetical protein